MTNARYLLVPFFLQAVCIGIDEFYYHWRRGLPQWERLGHPLDTLAMLACLLWLWFVPPSALGWGGFLLLGLLSCLCVIKDEAVHQRECEAGELRLHALLFMLHPPVLWAAATLWPACHQLADQAAAGTTMLGWARQVLGGSILATFCFGLYQFVYWNFLWLQPVVTPNQLTTKSINN